VHRKDGQEHPECMADEVHDDDADEDDSKVVFRLTVLE
jgi:hypothetical protein